MRTKPIDEQFHKFRITVQPQQTYNASYILFPFDITMDDAPWVSDQVIYGYYPGMVYFRSDLNSGDYFIIDYVAYDLTAQPPPNIPPVVTIASPVGGEQWVRGSVHAIAWSMNDDEDPDANLTVYVNYTTGAVTTPIAQALKGLESCQWTVPDILATDVVVNVTVIDTWGLRGWAQSGPFTIKAQPPNTPPWVTIISPMGGELWEQGSLHNVTWSMGDLEEPDPDLTVFVNYSTGGLSRPIAQGLMGLERFEWELPDIVASDVVVNITVIDGGGLRGWAQSGPIEIKAPSTQPPGDSASQNSWIPVIIIVFAVPIILILVAFKRRRAKGAGREAPPPG